MESIGKGSVINALKVQQISAGNIQEEPLKEIPDQLERLTSVIAYLEDLTMSLVQRLTPISVAIIAGKPESSSRECATQMGSAINAQTMRLGTVTEHLQCLLNNIQI